MSKKFNYYYWLETSSKSLYLLTLFLKTGFLLINIILLSLLFDISSDFVLLINLSSAARSSLVILFLPPNNGSDLSGDLIFSNFLISCNFTELPFTLLSFLIRRPPWWFLPFFNLLEDVVVLVESSWWSWWVLVFDEEELKEEFWVLFSSFSLIIKHQLQRLYSSAFGYILLQYLSSKKKKKKITTKICKIRELINNS